MTRCCLACFGSPRLLAKAVAASKPVAPVAHTPGYCSTCHQLLPHQHISADFDTDPLPANPPACTEPACPSVRRTSNSSTTSSSACSFSYASYGRYPPQYPPLNALVTNCLPTSHRRYPSYLIGPPASASTIASASVAVVRRKRYNDSNDPFRGHEYDVRERTETRTRNAHDLKRAYTNSMSLHLKILHKGKPLALENAPTSSTKLATLRGDVATTLSVPATNVRLLAHGKSLTDDDATLASLLPRPTSPTKPSTILVLATAPAALPPPPPAPRAPPYAVASARPRAPNAMASVSASAAFGFEKLTPLPGYADEAAALALLQRLSSDAGILRAMRLRNWRVGELAEMPAQGRVGIDPVCILGLNVNHGQRVLLRLRTDDGQGFRPLASLRHVLAHELAHIEESDHNNKFKEIMRWVERTAAGVDWRGAGGRVLEDGARAREADWRSEVPSTAQHRVLRATQQRRRRDAVFDDEDDSVPRSGRAAGSRLLVEYEERRGKPGEDSSERKDGTGNGRE